VCFYKTSTRKIPHIDQARHISRMQIHVDLSMDSENQIRIFSKSKRDSTMDRDATLPIIRAALGLPQDSNHCPVLTERLSAPVKPSIRRSVILEAEMVAFSERTHAIDGELFCTLKYLIWVLRFRCIFQSSGGYVASSNPPPRESDDECPSHRNSNSNGP
jgi:hypothetical protein